MAGSSLSGPHPTIAGLFPILTGTTNLILFATSTDTAQPGTATIDITANVYEHGCILVRNSASGTASIVVNAGTSASPAWAFITINY